MGLNPQKGTATNKEDEMQIKEEENPNDEPLEKQVQPETTDSSEDDDSTEIRKNEEEIHMPIRGSIKWEKSRTSARVTKKPDRWGNNIMISKIEQESPPEEASLPSVIEIPNPNPM